MEQLSPRGFVREVSTAAKYRRACRRGALVSRRIRQVVRLVLLLCALSPVIAWQWAKLQLVVAKAVGENVQAPAQQPPQELEPLPNLEPVAPRPPRDLIPQHEEPLSEAIDEPVVVYEAPYVELAEEHQPAQVLSVGPTSLEGVGDAEEASDADEVEAPVPYETLDGVIPIDVLQKHMRRPLTDHFPDYEIRSLRVVSISNLIDDFEIDPPDGYLTADRIVTVRFPIETTFPSGSRGMREMADWVNKNIHVKLVISTRGRFDNKGSYVINDLVFAPIVDTTDGSCSFFTGKTVELQEQILVWAQPRHYNEQILREVLYERLRQMQRLGERLQNGAGVMVQVEAAKAF